MLSTARSSNAQIVAPLGVLQQSVASFTAAASNNVTVNCDMLSSSTFSGNGLFVSAYGRSACASCTGSTTALAQVTLLEGVPSSPVATLTFTLPGTAPEQPDVALAQYTDNAGANHTQVAVVWYDGGNNWFNIWEIGGAGTGTLTVTPYGKGPKRLNTSSGNAGDHPHIDMCSDASNLINGYPALQYYCIVWAEGTSSNLYHDFGDLQNGPTGGAINPVGTISGVTIPDVAGYFDNALSTPDYKMVISYIDGSGNLKVTDYNPSTLSISTKSITPGGALFYPRIEAMSQYYSGQVRWQVAACVNTGSAFEAVGYNAASSTATSLSSPLFSGDVKAPCVAAGLGPVWGNANWTNQNVNNYAYSTGFYPVTDTNVYSRIIDVSTGLLASSFTFQANALAVNYNWDVAQNFALSSSSNNGDETMGSWYDGSDIVMAFTHSGFWKQAPHGGGGGQQTQTDHNLSQFVNLNSGLLPAGDRLNFTAAPGSAWQVLDAQGKLVLQGKAGNEGKTDADISRLAAGPYILRCSAADKAAIQSQRFTKP